MGGDESSGPPAAPELLEADVELPLQRQFCLHDVVTYRSGVVNMLYVLSSASDSVEEGAALVCINLA